MDRLTLNFRLFLTGLALLMLVGLCVHRADAQTVTTTREGDADWRCCDDTACTTSTAHQRQDKAIESCINRSVADGKTRWIVPARYRVTVAAAVPEPDPAPAGAELTWTPPTRNVDGTPITGAISYRVEQQDGTNWTPLVTVSGTDYRAESATGCWRVSSVVGADVSDPIGPVCKQ